MNRFMAETFATREDAGVTMQRWINKGFDLEIVKV
jgi:hypothetical protein